MTQGIVRKDIKKYEIIKINWNKATQTTAITINIMQNLSEVLLGRQYSQNVFFFRLIL